MRAAAAGLAYFVLIFAIGTILGTLRVVAVAPHLGAFAAVVIELPFMLAASWMACLWSVRHFSTPTDLRSRLLMGGLAFGLLMSTELALTIFAFGGSVASHVAAYRTPSGLLGLAGQLAFALIPLAACRSSRTAP
jgi:hypothetical protein